MGIPDLTLVPPSPVTLVVRRKGSSNSVDIPVILAARRYDLSESETERQIPIGRTTLAPGHWEMRARVGPGQYVESIVNDFALPRRFSRIEQPADWFDIFIQMRAQSLVRITVSDQPASVAGSVAKAGTKVPGAPVFLWPMGDAVRRSLGGLVQMRADADGRFRFDGLPPGDYRVLATFDFTEVDEDALEAAHAVTVHAEASAQANVDAELWVAPFP